MLGGLPVEMVTMLGSSILGGVMSIWSQSIKAKQQEQKMKEVLMDRAFAGVVITPLDTHLMSAIVGLYFGGSLVNK
jgi:hypothetical protein